MKPTYLLILATAITTTIAQAVITDMRSTEGVTVTWAQDSSEGFNLSLSGTGIPFDRTEGTLSYYGWQPLGDAFKSPSRQWIIQAGLSVEVWRNAAGQFTSLDYQMMGNVWNTRLTDGFLLYDSADPGLVSAHYSELMTEKYQSGDALYFVDSGNGDRPLRCTA